jgi:MerR family transcriptional regulator, heat shock protein HspR
VRGVSSRQPDPAAGVYGISVAADLVGTGVQNLRAYEKAGLIRPSRTPGGTRLYSSDDIERMRRIAELVADGLNLNAIAMVLDLQDTNERLRTENAKFRTRSRSSDSAIPGAGSGSPSEERMSP